jgi:hypothetical protein
MPSMAPVELDFLGLRPPAAAADHHHGGTTTTTTCSSIRGLDRRWLNFFLPHFDRNRSLN